MANGLKDRENRGSINIWGGGGGGGLYWTMIIKQSTIGYCPHERHFTGLLWSVFKVLGDGFSKEAARRKNEKPGCGR